MKVVEFVKYGFNNTFFTVMNKASNIAMSVYLFINFHKLRCTMVYNYRNSISVFVKVLKVLVNNRKITLCTVFQVCYTVYRIPSLFQKRR